MRAIPRKVKGQNTDFNDLKDEECIRVAQLRDGGCQARISIFPITL